MTHAIRGDAIAGFEGAVFVGQKETDILECQWALWRCINARYASLGIVK